MKVARWPIRRLLTERALRIPDYQRPYRWQPRSVLQLIDDVRAFAPLGAYRLGTVILHDNDDHLDVVDGQQRFVTLVMIAAILDELAFQDARPSHLATDEFAHHTVGQFGLADSARALSANAAHARELLARWSPDERDEFARFLFESCEVVVLSLPRIDEAFQMFDAQNTRGRALDPTDLLKAFHLREMESDAVPRETTLRMVALWESIKPAEISTLFAELLHPIRCWASGRPVPDGGFRVSDVDQFKGVRQGDPDNEHYAWARPMLYAKNFTEDFTQENAPLVRFGAIAPVEYPHQILQPIINGETFFTFVAHYHRLATLNGMLGDADLRDADLRDRPHAISWFEQHRRDRRYALVRRMFDALLLLYVDRFGELLVDDAAQYFARHVLSFRARHWAVRRSMINRFALGKADSDDGGVNLFAELRDTLRPHALVRRAVPRPAIPANVPAFRQFEHIVSTYWPDVPAPRMHDAPEPVGSAVGDALGDGLGTERGQR